MQMGWYCHEYDQRMHVYKDVGKETNKISKATKSNYQIPRY